MPKFKKKPIEVEAFRWDGSPVPGFMTVTNPSIDGATTRPTLQVPTCMGVMYAEVGQWVVSESGTNHLLTDEEFSAEVCVGENAGDRFCRKAVSFLRQTTMPPPGRSAMIVSENECATPEILADAKRVGCHLSDPAGGPGWVILHTGPRWIGEGSRADAVEEPSHA